MRLPSGVVLAIAYAAGAIPHAQLAARLLRSAIIAHAGPGVAGLAWRRRGRPG